MPVSNSWKSTSPEPKARRRPQSIPGFFGGDGVLDVNVKDMPVERLDRFDRIAAAVKDHVGRIEIDADVAARQIVEELQQLRRRFLAGFQSEGDSRLRADPRPPRRPA